MKEKPKDDVVKYVLKNIKRNTVWHEQFYTRQDAQGFLDYKKSQNIDIKDWEIIVVYPKESND